MRPVQQNNMNKNRSRGRGRGKPHIGGGSSGGGSGGGNMGAGANGVVNLNRTLDSNGPDIKIRGTVAHIYEKYQTLARDANSQGDHVGAENYLQHAEHYYRLLAAANQAQAAVRERDNLRQNGSRRLSNAEGGQESGAAQEGSFDNSSQEGRDGMSSESEQESSFEENING